VVVLGARQCGKSTLVRELARARRGGVEMFDLERRADRERFETAPESDLGELQRKHVLLCLDEIQRVPALFEVLRPLLDEPTRRAKYVLLGSASPSIVRGVSESLAGRVAFVDLSPFLASEVVTSDTLLRRLWLRGGFPRSYLARSDAQSFAWREDYLRTVVERDVPALGYSLPAPQLSRMLQMLAHLHGGQVNASELAGSLSVSAPTVTRWLDVVEGVYLIRRLQPWARNVGKRVTKAPKMYLRDSGLLHALLGLSTLGAVRSHPKAGASWEGFVVEQIIGAFHSLGEHATFSYYRTHAGTEVDLVIEHRGKVVPVEIKLGDAPTIGRGFSEAVEDLGASHGLVVYAGEREFRIKERGWAVPASMLCDAKQLVKTVQSTLR
jgi:predicted AAA+ superfamily ATPase